MRCSSLVKDADDNFSVQKMGPKKFSKLQGLLNCKSMVILRDLPDKNSAFLGWCHRMMLPPSILGTWGGIYFPLHGDSSTKNIQP